MWGRKTNRMGDEGQTDAVWPNDKALWQYRQQVLFSDGLSGSMPGIVYYEFAVL